MTEVFVMINRSLIGIIGILLHALLTWIRFDNTELQIVSFARFAYSVSFLITQ